MHYTQTRESKLTLTPARWLRSAALAYVLGLCGLATCAEGLNAWVGAHQRVGTWSGAQPAERVRLSLRQTGVYRVTAAEIAAAGGWQSNAIAAAIATTNLQLTCQGHDVAWLGHDNALLFYGEPADDFYAAENVYWLTPGPGVAIQPLQPPAPESGITNSWFHDTVTLQGTDYPSREGYGTLTNAPFLAFKGVIGNDTPYTQTIPLPHCLDGTWQGTLTARMISYYESAPIDNHSVQISVGSDIIGTNNWSGEQYVSAHLPFDSSSLDGTNAKVTVKNVFPNLLINGNTARFSPISYDITYRRDYSSDGKRLRCGGQGDAIIAATGLVSDDILVLDVTAPHNPLAIANAEIVPESGGATWQAVFPENGSNRVYEVVAADGFKTPAVRGADLVEWSTAKIPEFAIIIPPEGWRDDFRAAVQPLADHRNAEGLRTAIIDVESIYDSFTHGLATPYALRHFYASAAPRGLKYVLLAGCGTLDFKHSAFQVDDYTCCLIPTLVFGQGFSIINKGFSVPVDSFLADIDGDHKPDLAVGRISTTYPALISSTIAKTIAFERRRRWKEPVVLLADWSNTSGKDYTFDRANDQLKAPLEESGRTTLSIYNPVPGNAADVKTNELFTALQAGASFLHFFGHSSEVSLGESPHLLSESEPYKDISSDNWSDPMVAVMMGCRLNRWQSMSTSPRVVSTGVLKPAGGFVAGIGSCGDIMAELCNAFSQAFYGSLNATRRARRLGDMYLAGLRAASTYREEEVFNLSLYGDPTLLIGAREGTVFKLE